MAKKGPPPADTLIRAADQYAMNLMKSTGSATTAPDGSEGRTAGYDVQIDVLTSLTRYLHVRDKIVEPAQDDDWLSRARDSLRTDSPDGSPGRPAAQRRSRKQAGAAGLRPSEQAQRAAGADGTDIGERGGSATAHVPAAAPAEPSASTTADTKPNGHGS